MKRTIILLSFLLAVMVQAYAQTPTLTIHDHDIQLRATSRLSVVSPQQGMLVYDTSTQSLWYYDGLEWIDIGGDTVIKDIDGDTRVEAIDRLASSDLVRLRINGAYAMDISQEGQALKLGAMPFTESASLYVGRFAGLVDESSFNNVGIGQSALASVNDGIYTSGNIAIGRRSLENLGDGLVSGTSLSGNTAIGNAAGEDLIDGRGNTIYGAGAGVNMVEGTNNVLVGAGTASSYFTGGNENVIVGDFSAFGGYDAFTQSGAVKIGHDAGYADSTDNVLHIANTHTKSLIYGDFANDYLQVGGELNINDAYSLPTIDGTGNQVLATDGTGQVSWIDNLEPQWQDVPAGIAYDRVSITDSQLTFDTIGIINVEPTRWLKLQYNEIDRVGLYGTGLEWGPAENDEVSLGSQFFRFTEVWATNGTIQTSDLRKKKEIQELDAGLDEVRRLRPVSYQWNSGHDQETTHLGFVAQELEQVLPEVVSHSHTTDSDYNGRVVTNNNQGLYGVRYSEIIPVLVKAIQEQQIVIESLKQKSNRLATLEADLQQLRDTVKLLSSR